MRIAGSIRISRISRGASRSPISSPSRPTRSRRSAAIPETRTRRASFFKSSIRKKTRKDFLAAVAALKSLPDGNGKVGVVGFCYGGGIANFLATQCSRSWRRGSLLWRPAEGRRTSRAIKAPLLIHYAGVDDRINAGWPAYEAALKEAKVTYEAFIYPGVQHGFNNDTTPRYDEAAAKLAWGRTIDFFNAHLRS